MSDDKDWPHGHLAVWFDKTFPARIIDDKLPGPIPICAFIDGGTTHGFVRRLSADGVGHDCRLINAPAPVKEAWVNVWRRLLDSTCWYASGNFGSLSCAHEAAKNYETNTSAYIGTQRWCTDGTGGEIIGPDGKKVRL